MKNKVIHMLSAAALVVFAAAPAFARSTPTPVPEPGTFALLGLGAVGFVVYKRFKK